RRAHEIEQVGSFDVVELEGARDGVEDVFGDPTDRSAFELRVVLDADPGQHRDFFASQAGDPAAVAVCPKPGLIGCDASAARGEELPDLVPGGHPAHGRALPHPEGGAASTPINVL